MLPSPPSGERQDDLEARRRKAIAPASASFDLNVSWTITEKRHRQFPPDRLALGSRTILAPLL